MREPNLQIKNQYRIIFIRYLLLIYNNVSNSFSYPVSLLVAGTAGAGLGCAVAGGVVIAGEGAPGMAMLAGDAFVGVVGPGVVAGDTACPVAGELLAGGVLSCGPAEITALLPPSPDILHTHLLNQI